MFYIPVLAVCVYFLVCCVSYASKGVQKTKNQNGPTETVRNFEFWSIFSDFGFKISKFLVFGSVAMLDFFTLKPIESNRIELN